MKKHTMKITVTGLTIEDVIKYFRFYNRAGNNKASFEAANTEHAI